MKDVFVLLNNNIRELFRQTSFWIGVIIVLQVLMIWLIIYVYLELSDSNYHFYMNTKTSMESIHKDISMIGDAHHTPFHMVRSTPLGVETADR